VSFCIWIEFEQYDPPVTTDEDGFCNFAVNYDDGRSMGYDVWSVDFFRQQLPELLAEVAKGGVARCPDFIVARLDRAHIEEAVRQYAGNG
jgi:hypothetical protein